VVGVPDTPGMAADIFTVVAETGANIDMIVQNVSTAATSRTDISFTLPEVELQRARQSLEQVVLSLGGGELRVSGRLAKVSLVGIGVRSDPGVAAHLCRCLLRQGITVSGIAVSELRITCLVEEPAADQTVRALHEAFGLARESAAPPSPH